jgi:hypothetical protein
MKDLIQETQRLRKESQQRCADFVVTELELAKTFCDVAMRTDSADKMRRNLEQAVKAYRTAQKFSRRIRGVEGLRIRDMKEKFRRMRALLGQVKNSRVFQEDLRRTSAG